MVSAVTSLLSLLVLFISVFCLLMSENKVLWLAHRRDIQCIFGDIREYFLEKAMFKQDLKEE